MREVERTKNLLQKKVFGFRNFSEAKNVKKQEINVCFLSPISLASKRSFYSLGFDFTQKARKRGHAKALFSVVPLGGAESSSSLEPLLVVVVAVPAAPPLRRGREPLRREVNGCHRRYHDLFCKEREKERLRGKERERERKKKVSFIFL